MAHVTEGDEAKAWSERAGLITPIAKAFATDIGNGSGPRFGVQVHGGMGFIEGDRCGPGCCAIPAIAPIYDRGTNGHSRAIDPVTAKPALVGAGRGPGWPNADRRISRP